MIKIVRQGIAWTVLRNGLPVQEAGNSGVPATKGSAFRYAKPIADRIGEELDVEGGMDGVGDEPAADDPDA